MNTISHFYKIEEISENTYRIEENGAVNCYLLIGDTKALLVDACWGIGNLKHCVTHLTKKPIIVAVTHMHPDHIGGTFQFGNFYAHKKDDTLFNNFLGNRFLHRLVTMKSNGKQEVCKRRRKFFIENGHIFDLGNREVEVKLIPGHTAGSLMFIDYANKILFTGDNMNPHLWMHMPGSVSLEEWSESARQILCYMENGYSAYIGHENGVMTKDQAETIYSYVQEIIEKNGKAAYYDQTVPIPQKIPSPKFFLIYEM